MNKRRMRFSGHITSIEGKKIAFRVLLGKLNESGR
jgi:hypothetical protein